MTTKTLTRQEIIESLELPPEVVDAMIASGAVLCHVRDGEARVPLAQLELFFRERLLRVYRTEAVAGQPAAEPVAPRMPVAVEPEPEPAPPAPMPVAQLPIAAPVAESPFDITIEAEEPETEPDRADMELRRKPRWIPNRQIDGFFNEVKFTILQISETGLRIRHTEPLLPGDEAKLTFALMSPPRSFMLRARVVWTSLARTAEGAPAFSISGLRVTEHADRLGNAIDLLRSTHALQPERRVHPPRRETDAASAIAGISDDEVSAVMVAAQKFASDPELATRYYARGRFALSDESVRRSAPPRPRDREEVLALWEFLDRQIDIPKITGVVNWMRKNRVAAV